MGEYPYRFIAAKGMHAGQTFIYFRDRSVVSYQTDSPAHYFVTWPPDAGGPMAGQSRKRDMTPEVLARFSAIPERVGSVSVPGADDEPEEG